MSIDRINELPRLPHRPDDAHKGTFGRALIVGGSRGMSGAVSLAGLGALRGGAGLVYLAVPQSIVSSVAAIEPSYLTIPLTDDDHGRLGEPARAELANAISNQNAVAVGPGLGTSDELIPLVNWLFHSVPLPLVVDADGLNALAKLPNGLSQNDASSAASARAARILTPHPGEFARLTGHDIGSIQSNREELAVEFAREHNVVLLLKGPGTVVTDGQQVANNTTGNSGMATGGTGDVLTGLIVALLAQGMDAFAAAQLGAHLHGLAGDLAAKALSQQALIASDLPRFLGQAWRQISGL